MNFSAILYTSIQTYINIINYIDFSISQRIKGNKNMTNLIYMYIIFKYEKSGFSKFCSIILIFYLLLLSLNIKYLNTKLNSVLNIFIYHF